jgi:hypothetical protein
VLNMKHLTNIFITSYYSYKKKSLPFTVPGIQNFRFNQSVIKLLPNIYLVMLCSFELLSIFNLERKINISYLI